MPEHNEEPEFDVEDFDLEEEYKPTPLIADGKYTGNVTNVKWGASCIVWEVALEGNDGVMSDGETSIDGATGQAKNWMPKAGDDKILTKDGKMSKRQFKINALQKFAETMQIDMNTLDTIMLAIDNADWIGIPVVVEVTSDEYPVGTIRNVFDRMVRDTAAE